MMKQTDKKINDIIFKILEEIKNKFQIISEKIIADTISSMHYYYTTFENIFKFFKDNGFKIKTKKIFVNLLNCFNNDFLDIIDFDKIIIDEEILEKILFSGYMHNSNFGHLEKIYDIVKKNTDIDFTKILIKIISHIRFYESQDVQRKIFNIFNFITKINPSRCLEIIQHIPFIVFCDNYFEGELNFYDEDFNINNMITKLKNNINTTFNMYLKKINNNFNNLNKLNNMYNIKTYGGIDNKIIKELYELTNPILIESTKSKKIRKNRRFRRPNRTKILDSENIINDDVYYDFIDESKYNFSGKVFTGLEIKEVYNLTRRIFFDYIKDKFTKETNIINIINCRIFRYNNFLINYDEKINLFKNIFNGKILANDITSFITNNNEIADFLIINSKSNENIIKIAFKMSNYKFINKLIELKYNIKTSYIKYINDDKHLVDILKIINKYNTLEFDDEFEWAIHIKYLNPNINIGEYIYDDNNEDLRKKLNEKINKYYENYDIVKVNLMKYNEFVEYINSNKIKIKIEDLIKINDYKKRVILLDHIKM